MTPELQSVLDRLDEAERRSRRLGSLALLGVLLSLTALGFAIAAQLSPPPAAPAGAAGVVEGTRFLLRDPGGKVRGGMEVERDGTVKLALGPQDGQSGAAVILAQPTGLVQIQLRSPTGVVRAALNGGVEPSLTLTSDDAVSSAALVTKSNGPGQLLLSDRAGTIRPAR
jgi:hypothetical protein